MANAFSVFRRRQKLMLAVLGIVAMFGFVIGPTLLDVLGGHRADRNPAAVTTIYGTLHDSELHAMKIARNHANNLLYEIKAVANNPGSQYYFGLDNEPSVVDTMLLTHAAERMGVVVGDDAINQFLHEESRGQLKREQLRDAIAHQHLSVRDIYEILRDELMARRLQELFFHGFSDDPPNQYGDPPGQRWDYFQRLRRFAKTEIVPIPVSDFADKVEEPGDTELRSFFDKYKDQYSAAFRQFAGMESEDGPAAPGFKVPAKVNFKYFVARYEDFVAKAEVTDKEIEDYYKKNKSRYKRGELPFPEVPKSTTPDKAAGEKTSGDKATGDKATGDKATDTKATDGAKENGGAEPKDGAEPKEGTESNAPEGPPAETKDENKSPGENPPVDKPAADDKAGSGETPAAVETPAPDGSKEGADPTAPKEDNRASRTETAKYLNVAFQTPAKETDETPAAAEKPAADATTDSAASDADNTKAKPDDTKANPDDTDTKPEGTDGGTNDTAGDTEKKPSAEDKKKTPSTKIKPDTYKPLEEVREQIRKQLVGEKAAKTMSEVLSNVQQTLDDYYQEKIAAEAAGRKPPAKPDFVALAKQHGLPAPKETGIVTAYQLRSNTELGKSYNRSGESFVNIAFRESLALWQPTQSEDSDFNRYLACKIKQTKEIVPSLNDKRSRAEVVRVWKLVQARELAQKHAEKLATTARKAKKPLKEVFRGKKKIRVKEPAPFTWLQQSTYWMYENRPPQLSEVQGVDHPGSDFMKAVFGLQAGQVGVATNELQTMVYVIRLASYDPSEKMLQVNFMADQRYYRQVALEDQQELYRAWMDSVRKEAGVDWQRTPNYDVLR